MQRALFNSSLLRSRINPLCQTAALPLAVAAIGLFGLGVQAATLQVTVLDRDGKPAPDAVVIVLPAAKGAARHTPAMAAVIAQEKMQFVPPVTVVSTGAKVRFVNNDPWDHHVRLAVPGTPAGTATSSSDGYALRLEGKTENKAPSSAELTLDKPGAVGAALLGCFIHGSMSGYIYVADSPWTVKTGADGVATLDDLPEGAATVKVWHPAQIVDKTPVAMVIGAAPAKTTVQLDVVPRRRRI